MTSLREMVYRINMRSSDARMRGNTVQLKSKYLRQRSERALERSVALRKKYEHRTAPT